MRAAPLLLLLLAACAAPPPDAPRGGFVQPSRAELEARLEASRAAREIAPDDPAVAVWHGRCLAYLGRYAEAERAFGEALARWPDSVELLRHRGHRRITLRRFEDAEADLARASELVRGLPDAPEHDGMPNRYGIPRSTLAFNVEYHLALARYLRGDFEGALEAWLRCLERARVNDDLRVAAGHWTYLTLRRLGREDEARALARSLVDATQILENEAYQDSLRVARGELAPDALSAPSAGGDLAAAVDDASRAYAAACHLAFAGRTREARQLLEALVLRHAGGPAFGLIAAEVELTRGWPWAGEEPALARSPTGG